MASACLTVDYYLEKNDRMNTIRQKYVAHMVKMFSLLGDTPEQAQKEADAVMRIETALAEGSMPRVDMRDPGQCLPHQKHWQSFRL